MHLARGLIITGLRSNAGGLALSFLVFLGRCGRGMEQSAGVFAQNVASQSGKSGFHPASGDRCEFLVLWRSEVPFPSPAALVRRASCCPYLTTPNFYPFR